MRTNPYSSPKAFPADDPGLSDVPFGWKLGFWILVADIAIDLGIVASRLTEGNQGGGPTTMVALALISLAQSIMVFAIRWLLFRLILRRRRPGELRGIVPLVGVVVIFAMVKLIEHQGYRLWSGSGELAKFLVFLVPSLVLVVSMSPRRLGRFQARGRHLRSLESGLLSAVRP